MKNFDDLQILVNSLLAFDVDPDTVTDAFAEVFDDQWDEVTDFGVTVEAMAEWAEDAGLAEDEVDDWVCRLADELLQSV